MGRRGAAVTEFAVLLPVYVLLVVGLIFFANEILFWQEAPMSARFLATNTRDPALAPPGTPSPMIALTDGTFVPQDYFLMGTMQNQPQFQTGAQPGLFTQTQVYEELVKASWHASQNWTLDNQTTFGQSLTGPGQVVYGNKPGMWEAVPDQYSFSGDDLLIADEISSWFNRRWAQVTLVHTSKYVNVGGFPVASVTARAEAVVREPGCKQRSLTASQMGFRKPIEDLVSRFGADEAPAGSLPLPHYPDFLPTSGFWTPN